MKRFALGALISVLLVGVLGLWLFGGDEVSTSYRTAAVERGDLVSTVTASGRVAAMVTVDVSSQLSGQVARLEVDYNAVVSERQVLARLDPQSFEARVRELEAELEVAEANVLMQKAGVERAKADLADAQGTLSVMQNRAASARANYADKQQDLERLQALQSRSAVSRSDLQNAGAERDSARALLQAATAEARVQEARIHAAEAALDIAQAGVRNAGAVVKQRQAALDQARVDLERTAIRSPIDGIVISRDVDLGQTVAASLQAPTLFTIAGDLSKIKVEASVDEADIGRVKAGQRVEFTVDAYPQRVFGGKVAQVRMAPQVFQNVVTYMVVIEAENSDQALFPGMTALVRVAVSELEDVLKVPNAALRFRPRSELAETARTSVSADSATVWVLVEGKAKPVEVTTGESDGSAIAVLDGDLEPGDQVILGAVRAGS
jgi:HlyD family secretion protein